MASLGLSSLCPAKTALAYHQGLSESSCTIFAERAEKSGPVSLSERTASTASRPHSHSYPSPAQPSPALLLSIIALRKKKHEDITPPLPRRYEDTLAIYTWMKGVAACLPRRKGEAVVIGMVCSPRWLARSRDVGGIVDPLSTNSLWRLEPLHVAASAIWGLSGRPRCLFF
ncbi:hypothetical protein TgHK011_004095 [Trichoderma gracile]|nr:hypothetical protein TgHK011_004095 [Trichoderma gracile]